MDNSFFLIILDGLSVLFGFFLLRKNLSFFHPFFIYLFFHLFSFTKRLWEILLFNAPLLYSDGINVRTIELEEIFRAILLADFALIVFASACKITHFTKINKNKRMVLSKNKVNFIAFTFFIIGLPAFILTRNTNISYNQFDQILTVMSLWPVLSICLLIYYYGFKWYLLILISPFLVFISLQGYHRFMLILPMLFLLSVYLYKKDLKWPNKKIILILITMLIIFPQLKYIGIAYNSRNFDEIFVRVQQAVLFQDDLEGSSNNFLDQYAGALTLIDESNKFYYGMTYTSLITIFVPRILWNEKPGLGDHTLALATTDRPYDVEGRVITYLGEAYINFWYMGFFIIPFILGVLLTRSYIKNIDSGYNSLQFYVFISFNVILIQVYRDGVSSLILFGILQNLVMVSVYFSHKLKWK